MRSVIGLRASTHERDQAAALASQIIESIAVVQPAATCRVIVITPTVAAHSNGDSPRITLLRRVGTDLDLDEVRYT